MTSFPPTPPPPDDVAAGISRMYADEHDRGDLDFDIILASFPGLEHDDDALSEAIDADARLRLERGLPVPLERYLDAVPDLSAMAVSLDAAIEFALRDMTGQDHENRRIPPMRNEKAVEELVSRFPELETQIRVAAMLNQAVFETTRVRRLAREVDDEAAMPLPMEYGPEMYDGRLRYELRTRLGGGAYGSVFLAVDRHLSDESRPAYTAIKILRHSREDPGAPTMREEAVRARRVDHPNVVRVLDRGTDDDGRGYVVYEYVDGPSLRDWLDHRTDPPGEREAARLVAQMAHGVQAAHAAGVVHCDLKPENILMARPPHDSGHPKKRVSEETPKIADFGLAVCLESVRAAAQHSPAGITAPSGNAAVLCSLSFVAPEQFRRDEGALAPPADVYALGGILYHLLTWRVPNGQNPHDAKHNLRKVDGESPRDKRGIRFERDTDPDLEAICRRALAMEVSERYASAEALASDLEAWLRREPIRWTKPGLVRRVRLFAVRQPLMLAMIAALLCGTTLAGAMAVRWQMQAEHRLMQARFDAAQKLEAETTEWRARQREMTSSFVQSISRLRTAQVAENFLTGTAAIESMMGPELLRDGHSLDLWQGRIEVARDLVQEARARGEPDVQGLLWETSLGFWLLNDGDPTEARRILARNRDSWAARTRPEDPWLDSLELLHACAIVREHLEQLPDPAPSSGGWLSRTSTTEGVAFEPEPELAAAIRTLQRETVVFRGAMTGGPAHRAVLRTLYTLYGSEYLDHPAERREVEKRLRAFSR